MAISHLPEGFVSNLVDVLEGGAGSNLGTLVVSCDSVGSIFEVGRVLWEGACPKLRSLCFHFNWGGSIAHLEKLEAGFQELRSWLGGRGIKVNRFP